MELQARFNPSLRSEHFSFQGFDVENHTSDWQHVVAVDRIFSNKICQDITPIVSGKQLQARSETMAHRKAVHDLWWDMALGGVAAPEHDRQYRKQP